MKNVIKLSLLSFIVLTSCMSTKVSSENNFDYSVLKPGSWYTIENKNGTKIRAFELTKVTESSIIGKQEEKELIIDKNDVNKVLKLSIGKTIPLIITGVGVAVLLPAYIKNKPVEL
ncbi:hypothetical protein JSO62_02515 [Riemerella anatipestifer]|uniref:hypothetical protein n=1 Tax=Riemerella anatipestifer TaxID=34085 RepID=UPI0030C63E19